MFVSQTHLPPLLNTSHYTDPAFHQLEVDRLFLPAWHCLAMWDQFPHDGDYHTVELFGRPLILWRTQDRIRTFLNVCSHRFCLLTNKARGRFQDRMKCQYHGWEYDCEGNTCRIPDAQSFRPLKKGELGLREYRTEQLGQLVFVTLNDEAPALEEYLGVDLVEMCQQRFSLQHRITYTWDHIAPCNWKVMIENLLESYHIESVHPKTFKRYPVPEHCSHTFHPTYDYYIHDYRDEPDSVAPEKLFCRLTGYPLDLKWRHILRYPSIAVAGAGPWYYFQQAFPITPQSCRIQSFVMHYAGPRGRWDTFLLHRVLKRLGTWAGRQINREDAGVFPSIQRGTASPDRPHGGGLISAREERVFAFQEFVLRATGQPLPDGHVPIGERRTADPQPVAEPAGVRS